MNAVANASESQPIATPKRELKLELLKEIKVPSAVLALDVSPGAEKFYAACLDGTVQEIDADSGTGAIIGKHDSYASGVALLPDQNSVVSAGYDGILQWHDLTSKQSVRKVVAHKFWSWQLAASPDAARIASVTGQYTCGGYRYEPGPESEPSVRVFDAMSGDLMASFEHVPPVQSVAFSPDSQFVAAGNLMGEVRIWEVASGKLAAQWTTPSFTGWGIIKGHYYTGGIFGMMFSPEGQELFVCGMGSTTDPAAGNGKQLWQRFAWRENPVRKVDETHEGEHGAGLMETLCWHPAHEWFVMAGRLFQGKWNTAIFSTKTGGLLHAIDAKLRVTKACFTKDGTRLVLAGATGQEKKKDGKYPEFGRIKIYSLV